MDLQIVPSICAIQKDETGADIAPAFTGSVTVKLPTMPERYRFQAKYGRRFVGRDLKKAVNATTEEEKLGANLELMELVADIADDIKDRWSKIDLTETATGKHITSVDDLYTYEPAFGAIADVGMKFINGFAEKK